MKRRYIALLIGLSLIVTLILGFPVRGIAVFKPEVLEAGDIQGTLRRGSITQPTALQPFVQQIIWHFRPSALLTARLGAALEASGQGLALRADGFMGLSGQPSFQDINGTLQAAALAQVPMLAMAQAQGEIELLDMRLQLQDQWPESAQGLIKWKNAKIESLISANFGEVVAEIKTESDGQIVAEFTNAGGEFTLSGIATLHRERTWDVEASISIPAGVNPSLESMVQSVGTRNADGSYRLQYSGQL